MAAAMSATIGEVHARRTWLRPSSISPSRRLPRSFSYPRASSCVSAQEPFRVSAQAGTAVEPILRCSRPTPRRSSSACSTIRAAANSSASNCLSVPRTSGTAISTTSRRASSTAIACMGPTTPEQGHRFNANKLLLDPYAKRLAGPAGVERRAFRLPHRQPARGSVLRPPRQCARHAQGGRGRRDLQLGPPRDPSQHPLGRHHHLRGPRQGPDADARGRAAEPARHLWRPVVARDDRASAAARRHHDRAASDPRLRRRPHSGREEARELLGLQHAVVLRAGAALRPGQSARRVPHHGGAAA